MPPSIIPLPAMTPSSAVYFCQVVRNYVFKSYAYNDELPEELLEAVPQRSSDLTTGRTIELLLFKQAAVSSEDHGSYEVNPHSEMNRLLKELERLPEKKTQIDFLNSLSKGFQEPRKDVLPVFDALVGQFVTGIQLLYPDDWEGRLGGMGVMSYLNAAGALELCGLLDTAEFLRTEAPRLCRKKGRIDGLTAASHIWVVEGRMDLAEAYFTAAIEEQ